MNLNVCKQKFQLKLYFINHFENIVEIMYNRIFIKYLDFQFKCLKRVYFLNSPDFVEIYKLLYSAKFTLFESYAN